MKVLAAIALIFFAGQMKAQLTTKLSGKVTEDGKPVASAEVIILEEGKMRYSVKTNERGEYRFFQIEPGTYSVIIWKDLEEKWRADEVSFAQGESKPLSMNLSSVQHVPVIIPSEMIAFKVDEVIVGESFDPTRIKDRGIRDVNSIASVTPGVINVGNALSFRGSRPNATAYYVDGMKLVGPPTLPLNAIQSIFVVTGGIPAEFGDFTGGVVSITTQNAGMRPDAGGFAIKPGQKKASGKRKNYMYENEIMKRGSETPVAG